MARPPPAGKRRRRDGTQALRAREGAPRGSGRLGLRLRLRGPVAAGARDRDQHEGGHRVAEAAHRWAEVVPVAGPAALAARRGPPVGLGQVWLARGVRMARAAGAVRIPRSARWFGAARLARGLGLARLARRGALA